MVSEISQRLESLQSLCKKHRVKSLWLFGSAASAEFDAATSDFDFLVDFHPHTRRGLDDVYFLLKEDLQSLFGRTVDLVEIGAITNPYFRQSVERHRVPLYAAA